MKSTKTLRWIIGKTRKHIPWLVFLTLAQVAQAFLGVMFALGTRQVIDSAMLGERRAFYRACFLQGSIIVGILVCLAVCRHLRDWLSSDLDRERKKDLLHILLQGEYKEVSSYHSGELLNRLNNDVRVLNEGILSIVPSMAALLTKLISAMAVLLALEPRFAVGILAAGVLVIVMTALMRKSLKALHKKVSSHDGVVSGFLQEIMEKLLMVQAMDVSEEVEKRADKLMEARFEVQRKRKNVSLFANTSVSVMYYGVGFVTLVWCAGKMLKGEMSFGSLTAMTQLVNQLQAPFTGMSGVIPQYIALIAAAERLMELENITTTVPEMLDSPQRVYDDLLGIMGDGVTFSYDREQILQDASFAIPKGAFVAIMGPSGVGKSTLLKLFLGIFSAESGSLEFDCGQKKLPLNRSTRGMFAYVPQGNLLLSGTLRENLTLVRPEATEKEIAEAVFVSAMEEYLPQLPEGLDTVIGENGVGLSEGQAQRLAIARAVLGQAPILLLDECTSALDQVTEQLVLKRLKALNGRMCIAVTHRPAALELCDYHLKVDDRKIICYDDRKMMGE